MSIHETHFSLLNRISFLAEQAGTNIAIAAKDGRLSYQALEEKAKTLAHFIKQQGIGRNSLVIIYLPRGLDMIIAMLGVMKSAAAYTVIEDDGNSIEHYRRFKHIPAHLIITSSTHIKNLTPLDIPVFSSEQWKTCTATDTLPEVMLEDTAYVLFTSGSTGVPKGVLISHGNIQHYITSLLNFLMIGEDLLRYVHVSTFSADLGNTCLLLSLWSGGTLYIMDDDTRKDPTAFFQYLITHHIDFLKITPSHWAAVFQVANKQYNYRMKYLVLGGESLSVNMAKTIMNANITQALVNHYGPTETTVGAIAHIITNGDALTCYTNTIPIGKPFGHTQILVKNEEGQYKSRLVEGELYIGGPSVGKGYLNDEVGTANRFVINPESHLRFYKTGDLVRVDRDGIIEFLGRMDRQVKIHGYRVELEHIEQVMRQLDHINQVIAYFLEVNGKAQLIAALTSKSIRLSISVLKVQLRQILPPYMVPSQFLVFDSFPLNNNGKIDIKALAELVKVRLQKFYNEKSSRQFSDPLFSEISLIWQKYLKHEQFNIDDDFFESGGSSIDAILVISDLQAKGYPISIHTFLKKPTIHALVQVISQDKYTSFVNTQQNSPKYQSHIFSSAQNWFFQQNFTDPNHWNQGILLQSSTNINANFLTQAVEKLLLTHPMLRTSYQQREGRHYAETREKNASDCLTVSQLFDANETSITEHIYTTSSSLNKYINLQRGDVFKIHLFKIKDHPDQLLFIIHHLSVDAISWRIIISDLANFYGGLNTSIHISSVYPAHSYWDWVEHIEQHRSQLQQDIGYWNDMISIPMKKNILLDDDKNNNEKYSKTIWLLFSKTESEYLGQELATLINVPLHVILLAVFTYELSQHLQQDNLIVDVESHGRLSLDEELDVSHVVGWFTSIFPLHIRINKAKLLQHIHQVNHLVSNVPHLGAAYGQRQQYLSAEVNNICQAKICYNYLGNLDFDYDSSLNLSISRYPISPVRGENNNRVYDFKLTARIIEQHLVVDLSFSSKKYSAENIMQCLQQTQQQLLSLIHLSAEHSAPLWIESGSSTGLLTYVPPPLVFTSSNHAKKSYKNIFLTGVTGYIGIYVFKQLLQDTSAHIYCLIRAKNTEAAIQRLANLYNWYFSGESLQSHRHRYSVFCGDIEKTSFALTPAQYNYLCTHIDAIYHFAANTRLFGKRKNFKEQNIDPVREIIHMASSCRRKDVHYMSTLAVCGVNEKINPVVFSERHLYIEQTFQNDYEYSKFQAEQLLHSFITQGGRGFIYRSGNVTGHSKTGKFQQNAQDNRFVQFLQAIIKLGQLPKHIDDSIMLSPVDQVAQGIVTISLNTTKPGTFHIDSSTQMPLNALFNSLRALGISLETSEAKNFVSLFEQHSDQHDPIIRLGHFWARRQPRNVQYDHRQTEALLHKLGCSFHPLDDNWRTNFLRDLIERGILFAQTQGEIYIR